VIILTNLPALVGIVNPNPMLVSGTANQLTPGPIPGIWSLDPNNASSQALGHLAAMDWLHGRIPWWNPFEGIGSPLAAGMQSAALFPPVLLFALANGSLYFHLFIEITGGLATYFLLRELSMSRLVAMVGGILFGLNGTFAWLSNAPMNPVAFLPVILLGIEMCATRPDSDAGWAVIAFGLALSLYAGFPETAYLDLLLAVVWAAVRLVQAGRGARRRLAGRFATGAGVGALLALPIAVPFLEYLHGAWVGPHSGTALSSMALGPMELPLLGLPYLYGPILAFASPGSHTGLRPFWGLAGGYITASTILLALVGLFGSRRERGLRIALGAFLAVVLLWQFGVPPFTGLADVIPFLSQVWVTRYLAPVWELAFVVAACFGLEVVGRDRRARVTVLAAGLAVLVGGLAVLAAGPAARAAVVSSVDPQAHLYATLTCVGALVVIVAVTVAAVLPRKLWTVAGVAGLLVVDAVVAAGVPQFSAPAAATVDQAPINYLSSHLGNGRFFALGLYVGDYGSYFAMSELDVTDLPVPGPWAREIVDHLGDNSYPANFDGAQVASSQGPSPAQMALANVSEYERFGVRYFVAPTSQRVFGRGPRYPDGLRPVFRDSLATIFALPHPSPYLSVSGGSCSLTVVTGDLVRAVCDKPAQLVRSELDVAGWSATVNGRPVPVSDPDGLLTAVRLPAGRSVISFSYAPPHINAAVGGFAVGLGIVLVAPVWRRRSSRRRKVPRHAAGRRPATQPLGLEGDDHPGESAGDEGQPQPSSTSLGSSIPK
jgi:hypothetical protein